MRLVVLEHEEDFDGWRRAARALAIEGVPAADLVWRVGDGAGELFGQIGTPVLGAPAFTVPRDFLELAERAIRHRDSQRFSLLYAMLLRIRAAGDALDDHADPSVHRLQRMAGEVKRDMHKMRAFVRFREVSVEEGVRYVAWFEPEHHIVRANAGFFVRRFATMSWSILTPRLSLHWDGEWLSEGPAACRRDGPSGDPLEEIWKTYYESVFNPARLKVRAMLKEMPKKYWRNLPETALAGRLIAGARAREAEMLSRSAALPAGD